MNDARVAQPAEPTVMPVDRDAWFAQLNASNFMNAAAEYRDIQSLPHVRKILIVGPGQGLDAAILRWKGYEVSTMDIDEKFSPDHLGSVHDLHMFRDRQFDVVVASHVLEHLPVRYLDRSLAELARVGRYALIYLPVAGRHFQWRVKADVKGLDKTFFVDVFNYFHKPDGETARYCAGQHYWELGYRGFRVAQLRRRLAQHFEILNAYRNADWNPSYNFVVGPKVRP
ncbi:MAG: methyltransferase domain-containing protein [Aquabacterium sp.]